MRARVCVGLCALQTATWGCALQDSSGPSKSAKKKAKKKAAAARKAAGDTTADSSEPSEPNGASKADVEIANGSTNGQQEADGSGEAAKKKKNKGKCSVTFTPLLPPPPHKSWRGSTCCQCMQAKRKRCRQTLPAYP